MSRKPQCRGYGGLKPSVLENSQTLVKYRVTVKVLDSADETKYKPADTSRYETIMQAICRYVYHIQRSQCYNA